MKGSGKGKGPPASRGKGGGVSISERIKLEAQARRERKEARIRMLSEPLEHDLAIIESMYSSMTQTVKQYDIRREYRIGEVMGQGAFGQIFSARRNSDHCTVAVKQTYSSTWDSAMTREFGVMLRCEHPNVVKLYDVFLMADSVFMVMEKVGRGMNQDLWHWLDSRMTTEEECATAVLHTARALEHIRHTVGILHRDLKPHNILVDHLQSSPLCLQQLKVTDFGSCKLVREDHAWHTFAAGTFWFQAPECIDPANRIYLDGKAVADYGPPADVWSLGSILHYMLSATFPFPQPEDAYRDNASPAMNSSSWSRRSRSCKALCARMLERNPELRCTLDEVIQDQWIGKYASELPCTQVEEIDAVDTNIELEREQT